MSTKHHLDEATLLSYAAGSLSQAMALVVACHLTLCPRCRARMAENEALGGHLLEQLPPAAINDNALDSLLSQLDDNHSIGVEMAQAGTLAPPECDDSLVPYPLNEYLPSALDTLPWRTLVSGIHYYDLDTPNRGVSRLMRIAPGKTLLPHTHDGNELTLVLSGSFSDDIGRFHRGDVADLDDQVEHQPLVDSATDCICLIATDAPLKFTTLLGRLVQPVTGF